MSVSQADGFPQDVDAHRSSSVVGGAGTNRWPWMAIVWKEWRQQRLVVGATLIAVMVAPFVGLAWFPRDVAGITAFAMISTVLLLGANTFAISDECTSSSLLYSLPYSRFKLFTIKFISVMAYTMGLSAVLLMVHHGVYQPISNQLVVAVVGSGLITALLLSATAAAASIGIGTLNTVLLAPVLVAGWALWVYALTRATELFATSLYHVVAPGLIVVIGLLLGSAYIWRTRAERAGMRFVGLHLMIACAVIFPASRYWYYSRDAQIVSAIDRVHSVLPSPSGDHVAIFGESIAHRPGLSDFFYQFRLQTRGLRLVIFDAKTGEVRVAEGLFSPPVPRYVPNALNVPIAPLLRSVDLWTPDGNVFVSGVYPGLLTQLALNIGADMRAFSISGERNVFTFWTSVAYDLEDQKNPLARAPEPQRRYHSLPLTQSTYFSQRSDGVAFWDRETGEVSDVQSPRPLKWPMRRANGDVYGVSVDTLSSRVYRFSPNRDVAESVAEFRDPGEQWHPGFHAPLLSMDARWLLIHDLSDRAVMYVGDIETEVLRRVAIPDKRVSVARFVPGMNAFVVVTKRAIMHYDIADSNWYPLFTFPASMQKPHISFTDAGTLLCNANDQSGKRQWYRIHDGHAIAIGDHSFVSIEGLGSEQLLGTRRKWQDSHWQYGLWAMDLEGNHQRPLFEWTQK